MVLGFVDPLVRVTLVLVTRAFSGVMNGMGMLFIIVLFLVNGNTAGMRGARRGGHVLDGPSEITASRHD